MENNFYKQLKKAKEDIKLSEEERLFHRAEILKIMERSVYSRKTRSPYFSFIFQKHFLVSGLTAMLVFAVGLTISAENSLPNEYLYKIKTKISEPILAFLTPTAGGKAKLGVDFVDRRLYEFSKVALTKDFNDEQRTALVGEFSVRVRNVQVEIQELVEDNNTVEAVEAANKLKSVLAAHDRILKRLKNETSENETTEISEDVSESLEFTNEIVYTLEAKINSSADIAEIDEELEEKQEEVLAVLEEIKEEIEEGKDGGWELAPEDEHYIEVELLNVNTLVDAAEEKEGKNNKKEAFIIYNQASQKLEEMKFLIEADQELEVDVLGGLKTNEIEEDLVEETKEVEQETKGEVEGAQDAVDELLE